MCQPDKMPFVILLLLSSCNIASQEQVVYYRNVEKPR